MSRIYQTKETRRERLLLADQKRKRLRVSAFRIADVRLAFYGIGTTHRGALGIALSRM